MQSETGAKCAGSGVRGARRIQSEMNAKQKRTYILYIFDI